MKKYLYRSRFYFVLHTMVSNGVTILGALRAPFETAAYQEAAYRLQEDVANGSTLADAMAKISLFPPFEVAMVRLGERSGRLGDIFRMLSATNEERYRLRRKLFSNLAYPIFVYIVAGPLLAVIRMFTANGTLPEAIRFLLFWMISPWGIYFILRGLWDFCHTHQGLTQVLDAIPFFGRMQYLQETYSFFHPLSMALHSGVPILEAIRISAQCGRSPAYKARFARMADSIQNEGMTFTEAFCAGKNPRDAASPLPSLLNSGEVSGSLEMSCEQIARLCTEEFSTKMNQLTTVAPIVLYAILVIYLAIQILTVASGYISQINQLL